MSDTWTQMSSNSIQLSEGVFEGRAGMLWLMGGGGASDPSTEVRNRRYIPSTDTWEALGTIANLPAPAVFGNHKGFVSDNTFYKIGNAQTTNTVLRVFEYDVSGNSWTEKTSQATTGTISRGSGVELDGKLYWVGAGDARVYDPASDSWGTFTPRPNAWGRPGTIGFNGRLHVVGGENAFGDKQTHHDIYDPSSDTWSSGAALPSGRSHLAMGNAGGSWVFVGGGVAANSQPSSDFWLYDPDTDSWTAKASSPSVDTAGNARLAVVNQQVWLYDLQGNDLYAYEPDVPMPSEVAATEGWGMLI